MAETAGYEGMIYYRHAYATGVMTFLSSSSTGTITATGSTIASAGFANSDTFNVASTSNNDGDYTIASVSGSVITTTVSGVLTNESSKAGTILNAIPGTALAGFYNWSITYGADAHEATDFANSGVRTYVPGLTNWTATATRRYSTASSKASLVGGVVQHVRFFLRYRAIPTSADKAVYLQGSAYITGADTTTDIDAAIGQTFNFQGTGALTLVEKADTWNT